MKKLNIPAKPKSTEARLLWADVIRIIAIYFVIQIHTSIQAPYTNINTVLFGKLDIMGVPLFVILSGALLLNKDEGYKIFFKKRCTKVLIPWIIWTFLYMTYYFNIHHSQIILKYFKNDSSVNTQWFHFFIVMFMTNLWFLPMIFTIYLLTPLIRIITQNATNKDQLYFVILWFISISLIPYILNSPLFPIWEPNTVYTAIQYSGYFFIGNILSNFKRINDRKVIIILLIGIAPFITSLIPLDSSVFKNITDGYLYPGTVIASTFFFYFSYSMFNSNLNIYLSPLFRKIIAMISGASFGVYILNDMFLDYYSKELVKIPTVFHTELLMTLLTFIFLSLIVILIQKIPLIKYIIP